MAREEEVVDPQLEESRERYRLLFEQSPVGIVQYDSDLRLTESNDTFRRFLGSSFDKLIGLDLRRLRDQRVVPALRAALDGREGKYEGPYQATTTPVQLWVSMRTVPFRGPSGEVEGGICIVEDITERKRHEEQIERMAFFDELTGLYNRRMLQERAEQSLELARRHRWPVALLFLDLDRFKRINDTLGHAAGDELLGEIARLFRSALRASDTLARLGGDEFALLLDRADGDHACGVARRLLDLLDRPFEIRHQQLRVGASVGVALFPDHGDCLEELLKNADIAMYRAKAQGGTFRLFEPGSPFTRQQLQLETELRQAVAAGDLELHYQPIESLADGSLVGLEALVRWRRAGELLAASEFIPLAEESDLIRLLDFQILGQALTEASVLLSGRTLEIAVNLSPRTLHARELPEHLKAILDQTRLAPDRVVLEITETAAVHDPEGAIDTLHRIAELGVRLAMDDFGTGFASLTYLRGMPLNRVKIDGSLTAQIGIDPKGERLVRSAIDLAHGLGLEVVGEGVERPEQLDWLRRHGCDLAQGYLVGHPVEAADARSIVRSARQPGSG